MASANPIDFAPLMGKVAHRLLGEPNKALSSARTLRWGTHGSLKVDLDPGAFHDKEANQGGGVLDLIMREQRCDKRGALDWLEHEGLIEAEAIQTRPASTKVFYDYAGADGVIAFRVERRGKDMSPPFLQHGPDGRGGFHAAKGCMTGVLRLPYRLPELLAAPMDAIVFVVEGEKDADRLAAAGLIATTNSEGAGKFRAELAPHFASRRVVVVPDNDKPGADHAADVAAKLTGIAASIVTLTLPGLPTKGDVSDWLAQGGTAAQLQKLADEALRFSTPSQRTIDVRDGVLHTMATEAETALIETAAPLYVRGGIVRPVVDEMAAAHGQRTKVARLCTVDGDTLVDHLSRAATWTKFNARKNAPVKTDPPRKVALTILARDGEWRFPKLSGVITTPTLRPDGTVLSAPGYDRETQLLLLDPPSLPTIPDQPTRVQALTALSILDDLLNEFPFVDAASRSVALSGLITPVVRGAMQVAPLHATTAPVAGSGKSYIIDLASAISTGERAPVIAVGRTEEETEKRLGAALLNGQAIVSIDNVNGQLGGDALCQMIERPVVSVRPLGVSKLVKIESRATCFATGNNIQLVGDMTRRVVVCSLDPNMERPELRTFASSPFHAVISDRGRYVAAALIVARGYAAAGFPSPMPALASFEDWSRVVRSALVWLGRADPVETMEKARSEDPVISTLSSILTAWYDAVGAAGRTTGEIKAMTELRDTFGGTIHHELRDALADVADDRRGGIDAKRLGRFLGRFHGRIVGGMKLVAGDDAHAKQRMWKVVRA